jgi:hypothetical protein
MRDGVNLAADVYLPRLPRGPYPAILIRTPYGKHEITSREARFACRNGYALVVQDMRGHFRSAGDRERMLSGDGWGENRDGHDTIRWIARQPWSNGRVATWGPSAMGFAQNLLAPDAPPALRAQYVLMAFSDMYSHVAYPGGAFRKALVENWLREARLGDRALRTVREHPAYDAFWEQLNMDRAAHRMNVPAVFIGGWYDAFAQGTIDAFVARQRGGGPRARGHCRLIVGPWSHDDIRRLVDPRSSKSLLPSAGDVVRFFDSQLACRYGGADKPVWYYAMGDRCGPPASRGGWRWADDWPPPSTAVAYYLDAGGRLGTAPPQDSGARLSYRYDPADPVPTRGGQNLFLPAGPLDQRPIESRPDVLLFTSDALDEPVEVAGRVTATLYVSSDAPDTDFTVKLSDVYPDGRSMLVCDGILRARFRESFERAVPMEPGRVYAIRVDLGSTAIVFGRRHRIRVAVSSSNAPRFEPNFNTGQPWRADAEPRVATNTLYASADEASRLVLPVRPAR